MHAHVHKTTAGGALSRAIIKFDPAGATLRLHDTQFAQLHGAHGWTVRVLRGAVWITQDGDVRDVILKEGESFSIDRRGLALLSPFDDAQVCISLSGRCQSVQQPARETAAALPAGAPPAFA